MNQSEIAQQIKTNRNGIIASSHCLSVWTKERKKQKERINLLAAEQGALKRERKRLQREADRERNSSQSSLT
jgi:hypothetical protein